MPTDKKGTSYTYKNSGTNSQVRPLVVLMENEHEADLSQGNHYCSRDYGSDAVNQNAYHYSNQYLLRLLGNADLDTD